VAPIVPIQELVEVAAGAEDGPALRLPASRRARR